MGYDRQLRERAIEAAERLFEAPSETSDIFEPADDRTAAAAILRFGELFDELRGIAKTVMESARNSGDLVSSDPLQGVAEMVQNADDVEATEVRLLLKPTELLVSHNGSPVRLSHVLALATPWLTTKGGQAALLGRFGIGLTTLRSLSETLEVHCHPYHVRFGDPFVSPIGPRHMPTGFDLKGWTTFRVPLAKGKVNPAELSTWLDRWDDSALLFLRTVSRITLRTRRGKTVSGLAISREQQAELPLRLSSAIGNVSRERVTAHGGRHWQVYRAEFPTPKGITRAHKATEATTPVGIALPLHDVATGKIHAGLPVAHTGIAVFANAQFDPTTSRQEFPDNEWNRALVPLVAELWAGAVLDGFDRDPKSAWQAIPVKEATDEESQMPIIRRLEAEVITIARERVAPRLMLPVAGKGKLPLRGLAVEDRPLEPVLMLAETAELAGLDATIPMEVRDVTGKWREVLEDWRRAGVDLPTPVSVRQALALLKDERRPPDAVIALASVGIKEGLSERLFELPCVIARDDRRLAPPLEDAPEAVALEVSPLAEQLGVVTPLHRSHMDDEPGARRFLDWLRQCGAVVDGADDHEVVQRLAAAGRSERHDPQPLTVEQLQALRAIFERLEQVDRERLGSDVGRAVKLEAYQYELKGGKKRRRETTVQAVNAYLPQTIEREESGLAVAAEKAPGIVWTNGRYVRHLRSSQGRRGVGAQRFLRLLGVETAPRVRPHPGLRRLYNVDPRPALPARIDGGVPARTELLAELGATHSLEDLDSPALKAVIEDIARVRGGRKRRRRAAALVSTLARAWDRLGHCSEVQSAYPYNGWNDKGSIPAYWVWQTRGTEWLDDERGKPRRPSELRVRTAGTEAIYGADRSNYLHADLYRENWQPVLTTLGVLGDPSRQQLVTRLKELRDPTQAGMCPLEEVERQTAIVYKALAQSIRGASSRSDLTTGQLRREFSSGEGLILTDSGWRTPRHVFGGEPVLGRYGVFAPAVADTSALWEALGLSRPTVMDCVNVIRKIARRFPVERSDAAILLDALRVVANGNSANATPQQRRALRELPLLTRRRWVRQRPVYATDDPLLADSLEDHVAIWRPGGDLQQFSSALDVLRVRRVDAANAELIKPELAEEDEESTKFFREAVRQLHADLVRNDPDLAHAIAVPWDHLGNFDVRIHPSLALRVSLEKEAGEQYECSVAVKVDTDRSAVFVRNPRDLASVDRGGRALALLFRGDARRLAHAWRGACDRAEEGQRATVLELARERAAREERENEVGIRERTAAFREATSRRHPSGNKEIAKTKGGRATSERIGGTGDGEDTMPVPERRVLVDPDRLRLRDPRGRVTEKTNNNKPRAEQPRVGLVEPAGPAPPTTGTLAPSYTGEEKERVGLRLLEKVLDIDLIDVRAKRGVGADAFDEQNRAFELKVSSGREPDVVTLTTSEVVRAASDPDFFLAVVSGVEGPHARPTVRLFLDPLKQLRLGTDEVRINLSGIRTSESLVYEFEPDDVVIELDDEVRRHK